MSAIHNKDKMTLFARGNLLDFTNLLLTQGEQNPGGEDAVGEYYLPLPLSIQ
jgi:hypothetical protein